MIKQRWDIKGERERINYEKDYEKENLNSSNDSVSGLL